MEKDVKEKIDDHEGRLRVLEETSIRYGMLVETCTKAFEKLDTTMDSVAIAMSEMKSAITTLDTKVDKSDENIKIIGEKVDSLEEKGKFDYSQWIKDNFTKIIMIIILLSLAFPQIVDVVKSIF